MNAHRHTPGPRMAKDLCRGECDAETMNATSATPRTDMLARGMGSNCHVVDAKFARELELELATANARLAFMIDNAGQVFPLPNGWRCIWICDFGDEHRVSSHRTALEAIDAAIEKNEQINDDME